MKWYNYIEISYKPSRSLFAFMQISAEFNRCEKMANEFIAHIHNHSYIHSYLSINNVLELFFRLCLLVQLHHLYNSIVIYRLQLRAANHKAIGKLNGVYRMQYMVERKTINRKKMTFRIFRNSIPFFPWHPNTNKTNEIITFARKPTFLFIR